jgi:uncharacterized protein (DUF1697 family)
MTRHVAFLRGMNVGGHRITNDALCASFAALGLEGATAFLASGNVVFDADDEGEALERHIEDGLEAELGYAVPTFVRSADAVRRVAAYRPFDAAELEQTAGKLQVALLRTAPSNAARRDVLARSTADDRLVLEGRELYWLPRAGITDSEIDLDPFAKAVGGLTVRTHRTIVRLAARFLEAEDGP